MNVPRISSLRRSQDVAETLSKFHRVSELVGAPWWRTVAHLAVHHGKEGRGHCAKPMVGKSQPCVWSISTVSGHASRRTLRRIPKHNGVRTKPLARRTLRVRYSVPDETLVGSNGGRRAAL